MLLVSPGMPVGWGSKQKKYDIEAGRGGRFMLPREDFALRSCCRFCWLCHLQLEAISTRCHAENLCCVSTCEYECLQICISLEQGPGTAGDASREAGSLQSTLVQHFVGSASHDGHTWCTIWSVVAQGL